ncbi:MAG: hypothetical protein M3Q46_08510 [Verrucomicrobiota bacterium]|nr:hypothetical protein [Verrucomicrobiota bacterium]
MKWCSAGLTLVNVATMAGLLLGIVGGGLDGGFAGLALVLGLAAAIYAWLETAPFVLRQKVVVPPPPQLPKSKRARRRMKLDTPPEVTAPPPRRWHFWGWAVGVVFALFAVRSFCWILWVDGKNYKIQSPFNLGDLSLHITYIKYFANGVALWPDNPVHVASSLRYPAGIDLFDSLLLLQHVDLVQALVWTGLLGSVATFYAFYRWGGPFAIAGFLFNGGLAGYVFFRTHQFIDYQSEKIAWKSIPLTMFLTQRGLLYAIPAGLLLLLHWRRKYFPSRPNEMISQRRGLLPWWVEWSLYATMPLFHVHTFLALSGVLAFWLLVGTWEMRKQIAILLSAAFVPATWIVWMITDHLQAKSILAWAPGWLQSDPGFSTSAVRFWIVNFGLTLPALIALVAVVIWRDRGNQVAQVTEGMEQEASAEVVAGPGWWERLCVSQSFAFVTPAALIFIFALFVKTAPWGWDNTKLIIWAYFICLPFLWRDLIARFPIPMRAGVCFLLFFSGFVSLLGGLSVGSPGFDIADRTELDAIATVVRRVPIEERFAAFPTFNHPLLLNGRKVVLGYPGHLWTQGFDYAPIEQQLTALMQGAPDWRERARALHARYLFWGENEKRNYASSSQPWRDQAAVVGTGFWGTIYDLEQPASALGQ